MARRLSYVSLGFSVWMAASLLERDSGAEWSALLIEWAPALELKAIFFVLLYLAIRYVLSYYEKTDTPNAP
jgi:ABC-type multidrug transport system permease subunit